MVWNWLRDLDRVRFEMNQLFRDSFPRRFDVYEQECDPPVNAYETPEEFVVTAEMPGADPGKFNISLTSGVLQLRGEYKSEEVKGYAIRSERPTGSFSRSVSLGDRLDPDKVHASYADGILTVRVAKAEASRPKQIEVKVK